MSRIVAIGECMVEMAPVEPAGTYRMGFAGDTMNTAWYLRQALPAEAQVDYLTAVGTDSVSDHMIGFFKEAGIGTDHIARRADSTVGLYMIQLDKGERSFNYWRGQSAARSLAQDPEALNRALEGADIAYFSGITLAILSDADRTRLCDGLRRFRTSGGEVVFDPNLRPRLWDSATQMTEAVMQAAAISDTVLPSHEDEAAWFGDADPEATAKRYADSGAQVVIVKNGAGQILGWDKGKTLHHDPAPVTNVLDTTAAGDSFNAGFLAARLSGECTAQSIATAAELAAKVVQHPGALMSGI